MSFTLLLKKQIQHCTRGVRLASPYWCGFCSACTEGREGRAGLSRAGRATSCSNTRSQLFFWDLRMMHKQVSLMVVFVE